MKWKWLPFAELSAKELYDVLQLRERVFHVEQRCIYRDIDSLDITARHLLGYHEDRLICYLRVCLQNDVLVIGRIVVDAAHRHRGMGRMMIKNTVGTLTEKYPGFAISLSSQMDQVGFYSALGFTKQGMPFDEAGVMRVKMVTAV